MNVQRPPVQDVLRIVYVRGARGGRQVALVLACGHWVVRRHAHHGVSADHLQAYLNEFAFRFNRRFYPFNAFRSLLGLSVAHESPTYEELYDGDWIHPGTTDGSVG